MTGDVAQENRAAGGETPRRLYCYAGGLLRPGRVRRILTLAGLRPALGLPGAEDPVGVWGRSPLAARGERVAARHGSPVIRIEDAFLRSVKTGRDGAPPLGLLIDRSGVHFDPSTPTDLERMLATHPLDDSALLQRARDGIGRLKAADLSKYNIHDPALPPPEPGYVLVVDQLKGDASIRHGGVAEGVFREMLAYAQIEHPGARILIKTHPETSGGHRPGHYGPDDESDRISLYDAPVSPWALMEGAIAVYAVSSQLGFEAILAGHKPRIFGRPFYGGWGLTTDEAPEPRRERRLTRAQLFAAAMILYPNWYDPCRDRLCSFEEAVDQLEAEARAFREDRHGHVAMGMRLWKRAPLQKVFGRARRMTFQDDPAKARATADETGRRLMVWAGKETPEMGEDLIRVEDGFLRSRGLGAALIPPLSLVTDPWGIYYDPTRESALERLIAAGPPPGGTLRAERLVRGLIRDHLSKYNITGQMPDLPLGHRILVPGQVEDDASIRLGAAEIRTNLDLLRQVRAAHPEAVIVYKPHPDVEAGLRSGAIPEAELSPLADVTARHADPIALIEACDEVWTMTSLMGFEALLRGRPVTCLGAPFYAGWGLTTDLGPVPARRRARPDIHALAHAALIAYPRYFDPVSGLPCPPEVVADRLAHGPLPRPGPANRLLAKAQGMMASRAHLWR
ncbi:capsular polysaccharide biosynthesis protein [Acidimangrovimonas sediminis]|uniref:capsular polysaccharide biosynthesis protein n=1 Tax=Acidimangrovimonas sediminis TaxID=2056283 RepID=UPI001E32906E|nr:capsular polysaccharide biosynthesis protein [Acidimangrovimonas sediminis]